jgi:hypothetical protein
MIAPIGMPTPRPILADVAKPLDPEVILSVDVLFVVVLPPQVVVFAARICPAAALKALPGAAQSVIVGTMVDVVRLAGWPVVTVADGLGLRSLGIEPWLNHLLSRLVSQQLMQVCCFRDQRLRIQTGILAFPRTRSGARFVENPKNAQWWAVREEETRVPCFWKHDKFAHIDTDTGTTRASETKYKSTIAVLERTRHDWVTFPA